jgi:hypothetical protein
VQHLVHREILVLRHDHCARFHSPRTNSTIRGALQPEVSYVFSVAARDSSWRASAGGSWASTRKRNQAVRRMGWSFCLAANSSTAVMSSGSRYG